jgi:hypothetical protein
VNESQLKFYEGTRPISQNRPNTSVLARPRPHSYRKAIGPQNRVSQPEITVKDDNRCKQSHMQDSDSQNRINEQINASRAFHRTPVGRD